MSTLAFVASSVVDNHTSSTTAVAARPAEVVAEDELFAFVAIIGQPTITPPDGWAPLGDPQDDGANLRTVVYRRTVTAGEPASYTWGYNQARKNLVVILAYRGQHTSPVFDWDATTGEEGTSHPTPTVRVPVGGWLVTFAAARNLGAPQCTWTINTGDEERYDSGSAQESPQQNITGCGYDSDGPVVTAGDYDRVLTSSAEVSLVTTWSVALRPTAATEVHVGWRIGTVAGGLVDVEPPAGIAFEGVDSALAAVSSASSLAVPVPAGVTAGQWMLAHVTAVANVTITAPAGDTWTQIGTTRVDGQLVTAVYRRLATGSEPSTYTWTFSSATRLAGHIVAYSGVNAADPVADFDNTGVTEAGTTLNLPGVDVPEGGWLVYFPADRRASPSVVQVWSTDDGADEKRAEVSGATGSSNQASSAVFDSDRALTESTPARTITASEGWSNAAAVWAVALRPA